jgi:hypothetical protein
MKILKFKNNTYNKLPYYQYFGTYNYILLPVTTSIGGLKIIIIKETIFYSPEKK